MYYLGNPEPENQSLELAQAHGMGFVDPATGMMIGSAAVGGVSALISAIKGPKKEKGPSAKQIEAAAEAERAAHAQEQNGWLAKYALLGGVLIVGGIVLIKVWKKRGAK